MELTARNGTSELTALTLAEGSQLVRTKKVSPVELTEACLSRIERLNPTLNAFITVTADTALDEARAAEAHIQQELWLGPLHGIPIALKDLVDTGGGWAPAGRKLFRKSLPLGGAQGVGRVKTAGAGFLGKVKPYRFALWGRSFGKAVRPG